MSKTLTLAVKTAFEAARGVFNTTQERVTISETLGLYVQTLGLPDALMTVQPTSVELRFYGKYKNGYWFDNGIKTQNVAPGLDIENAVYPAHSGGNGYVPFNSGDFAWCGISYRVGRRLENLVNGVYLTTYWRRDRLPGPRTEGSRRPRQRALSPRVPAHADGQGADR